MTNVKLDKTILSSFHEAFRNREKKTGSITVSGSIPGFSAQAFTADIPLERNQAAFEVYYERQGGYPRRIAGNSYIVLDLTWGGGQIYLFVNNVSANLLRIEIYVTNSGATASIATQVVDYTVYVFDTPFTT